MFTFLGGIVLLIVGGYFYGLLIEKIFGVSDKPTPAVTISDGVDYVPLPKWKNSLINLLDIAGTGPILGPIQGILFGPIAFITIPIGCIIGGFVHDYMNGMISVRNDGAQSPKLVRKYLGKPAGIVFAVFIVILLFFCCAVFIYTPADMITAGILKNQSISPSNPVVWIIYAIIILYYLVSAIFPIDKIIGKIYPVFGAVLILSTVGIFIGIFAKDFSLTEIWETGLRGTHPDNVNFMPVFFVTVACGIVSGFHSTQGTLVSRTLKCEKDGRTVFGNMMIAEGVIAMVWAAAAMGIFNSLIADKSTPATEMVTVISKEFLGEAGGIIAILGVVILAITSGDTVLRSIRLILSEAFSIPQKKSWTRVVFSLAILPFIVGLLVFAKINESGFSVLWRYFAWSNQTIAAIVFALITVYLINNGRCWIVSLVPGTFYVFVTISFIVNSNIGFGQSWTVSYIAGAVVASAYAAALLITAIRTAKGKRKAVQ